MTEPTECQVFHYAKIDAVLYAKNVVRTSAFYAEVAGLAATLILWTAKAGPHYSREFVTRPLRRQARRARGAVREGGILETVC